MGQLAWFGVLAWFVGVLTIAAGLFAVSVYLFRPSLPGFPSGGSGGSSKPVKPRNFTKKEVALFDGDGGRPLYLAVLGHVFDVTRGKSFYGKGGPYNAFTARDATVPLAKNEVDVDKLPMDGPLSVLTEDEIASAEKWKDFFAGKYPLVGYLTDGLRPLSVEEVEKESKEEDDGEGEGGGGKKEQ